MMTNRENALRILRFDNPERVMGGLPCYTMAYHGVNHQAYDDAYTVSDGHDRPLGEVWYDIWNTGWVKEQEAYMGFPKYPPLDSPDKLRDYCWPDPNDPRIYEKIYQRAASFDKSSDCFLAGAHRDTLWEKAYMLVGMENMMTYFYTEPDFAKEILHNIMNFQLGIAKHYLKAGIEVASCGDDLGTQQSTLFSPQIMEEFLMPEYRRLFSLYKEHNVIINFHSCGHIEPVIHYFIDLGIDVLNPVQATANDLRNLRALAGRKLSFAGAISTAVLMEGPVEAIDKAVCDTIALLGYDTGEASGHAGGYFCAPDQGMDFPEVYYDAYVAALEKYAKY